MIDLSKFTPQQVAALKAWWAKQNQQPANKG
jgi:hypothetical protein